MLEGASERRTVEKTLVVPCALSPFQHLHSPSVRQDIGQDGPMV